jgi:tyrosyl-tRNA synthetase
VPEPESVVVDASAIVDLQARTSHASSVGARLRGSRWHAPVHLDAEVLSALGRLERAAGALDAAEAANGVLALSELPIERHALTPLLLGAWALRHELCLVDGLNVELARQLGMRLIRTDQRLGPSCADRGNYQLDTLALLWCPVETVLSELKWRGLIALSTDEAALAEHFAAGPVNFYVGFDPTAPSLHFGNLVQLMVARALQRAGHNPLLVVGGSTGLIGDPKETSERVLNPKETVASWVENIRRQVEKFVSFSGSNPARVVNNLDWTGPLPVLDFLRDIGKHFPINRMLARDVVRTRLEEGISYTEFSYVLLQALDYLELFRNYGCTLQFGGSDQWGNITAGVELIRRVEGERVHAFATPLLTKADGTKFGKTETGTIWLDSAMTSPYAFHQYFLNVEDEKVIEYLKVFSERSRAEIEELEKQTRDAPHLRLAQRALADDVTDLVHSRAEREAAVAAAGALFGREDLRNLSEPTLAAVVAEVGGVDLLAGDGLPPVVEVFERSGVVASKAAARRAIAEGGAYLNNTRVEDPDAVLTPGDLLHGRFAIVRRGRRTVGAVTVTRR